MSRLKLLILCLLIAFKVSSQNDIQKKNEYVILTESQAKRVVKDLFLLDGLKENEVVLNKRIKNFQDKEEVYKHVIKTDDSIIATLREIIDVKDQIINKKKFLEFHSYIGIRSYNFDVANPAFYGRAQLELKKFNLGGQIVLQPETSINYNRSFYYNLYVEYKIF